MMIQELLAERNDSTLFNSDICYTEEGVTEVVLQQVELLLDRDIRNIGRALLLLESKAIGLGSAEAVVASVDLVINKSKAPDVQRAIEFVDDHLDVLGYAKDEENETRLGEMMRELLQLYERWLLQKEYERRTVRQFCNFAGWMMWIGPEENYKLVVEVTRRVFLRTRQLDALNVLAIGLEIQKAKEDGREQYDVMCVEDLQRAVDRGMASLGANDSLAFFEGRLANISPRRDAFSSSSMGSPRSLFSSRTL